MEHQSLQLSASGHDLGGDILFGRRLGFSGTPSDLLPVELGRCKYEKGSDGKMLALLTDAQVVQLRPLPPDWSPLGILHEVATASPPYHALIDTGALVTGLDNRAAAVALLDGGLEAQGFRGVVFFTDDGDQARAQRGVCAVVLCFAFNCSA